MNDEKIRLLRRSWNIIEPRSEDFIDLMYTRLFSRHPELKRLYSASISDTGHKLTNMLGLAVNVLEKKESITPTVQALGRRHTDYNIKREYFPYVKEAILHTIKTIVAEEYTPNLEQAWSEAYDAIEKIMEQEAAKMGKPF